VEIETDDAGLRPESLDRILASEPVKFVYAVPTFQNPTGRTLSLARRQQVAEILKRHNALLVEDDPYSDLRYVGQAVSTIKSLAPDNVVYITTLSKTFSPGMRIGICVAPGALHQWLVIARQGVDLHTNTLGQALASEYIAGGYLEKQVPKIVELYRPRREAMLAALERHMPEDFTWTTPDGGMFIWIVGPKGLNAEQLYARAVDRGVAFVPGRFFFVNDGDGLNTFRMNFTAANPETIGHAVALEADAIAQRLQTRGYKAYVVAPGAGGQAPNLAVRRSRPTKLAPA
jgi:2-aminoadipate transaminase